MCSDDDDDEDDDDDDETASVANKCLYFYSY